MPIYEKWSEVRIIDWIYANNNEIKFIIRDCLSFLWKFKVFLAGYSTLVRSHIL